MFEASGSVVAETWAARAPSPELAGALAVVVAEDLDDAALVEVVAAWRRLQSWASGHAALAAAALAERASMNPGWPAAAGRVAEPCVAAEELAMRLGCSRRAAHDLVGAGKAYDGPLWPSAEALMAGEIDESKARVLVRALGPVPGEIAVAVQAEVLPTASRRTTAQLAADVQRALVRVDPDEAAERSALAVAERRVCRPRVMPDGMAGIWTVLPAPAAVALHTELGAVARAAQRAGDTRTIDQLRADALCCAVLARGPARDDVTHASAPDDAVRAGAPDGVTRVGAFDERRTGDLVPDILGRLLSEPPLRADVRVVVPLDALLGVADGVAELDGYGALAPATAEALARNGTWRRLVTDPLSGTVLDVGRTRYRPPPGLAEHVRTRDGTCVRPGCPTSAARCEIDHTIPFGSSVDGDGDGVGDGARERPGADGVGVGVGVGDGDGGAEGGVGDGEGTTSHENLGCLCKRDHLVKTHAGFVLRQVAPGVFEWTTPTGHRYVERRALGEYSLATASTQVPATASTRASATGGEETGWPELLPEAREADGRVPERAPF